MHMHIKNREKSFALLYLCLCLYYIFNSGLLVIIKDFVLTIVFQLLCKSTSTAQLIISAWIQIIQINKIILRKGKHVLF